MNQHLALVEETRAPPAKPPGDCVLGPRRTAAARSSTTFVVTTAWLDDGVPVVSVTGELDLATAPALEEALRPVCDHAEGPVAVDLSRCDFIDVRGLHILLSAQERLERSHRPLVLITGNPNVLRIFQITRVDGLFQIHPSRAAATKGRASA